MHTRLPLVLCFSLLSACAGLDGGRGIPAPVEDRANQSGPPLPASPPPPASVPARTNPARTVVPGIDDLPPVGGDGEGRTEAVDRPLAHGEVEGEAHRRVHRLHRARAVERGRGHGGDQRQGA